MKKAHTYFHTLCTPNIEANQPGHVRLDTYKAGSTIDALNYLIVSMEKQKMWFFSYKDRNDTTMSLVYNLVTQQDAANNTGIATEMRKDSGSMNAIVGLTMLFLPGTFRATLLGAGISSAEASSARGLRVSHLWWVFLVVTVPLTGMIMVVWWLYQPWRLGHGRMSVSKASIVTFEAPAGFAQYSRSTINLVPASLLDQGALVSTVGETETEEAQFSLPSKLSIAPPHIVTIVRTSPVDCGERGSMSSYAGAYSEHLLSVYPRVIVSCLLLIETGPRTTPVA